MLCIKNRYPELQCFFLYIMISLYLINIIKIGERVWLLRSLQYAWDIKYSFI